MSEGAAVAFLLRFLFKYEQLRLPIGGFSYWRLWRLWRTGSAATTGTLVALLSLSEPTNLAMAPIIVAIIVGQGVKQSVVKLVSDSSVEDFRR